jgi:hypothetical protein
MGEQPIEEMEPEDVSEKLIQLFRGVERIAKLRVRDPVLRRELTEDTCWLLTLSMLCGKPPEYPLAWAQRILCRRIHRKAHSTRVSSLDPVVLDTLGAGTGRFSSVHSQAELQAFRTSLQNIEEKLLQRLTTVQARVYRTLLRCSSIKAAAREAGVTPSDLRRHIKAIVHKARRVALIT